MEPKYLVAPDNILDPDGGVMFVKGQEVAVSDPDTEALRRKQGFVDAGTIEPTWKDHVSHIAEKVARGEAGELFEDPTGESSTPAYVAKSALQGGADSVVHGLTGLEKGIVGGTLDLASAGARVLGGDKLADQLQDAKRFNEQMMDTKAADDLLLGGAFDNSREAWEKVMGVSEGLGQIAGGVAAAKPLAAGLKAAKVAKTAEGAMKGAFTAQMAAGGEEGARAQVLQGEDRDLTWREKAEVGYHTLKEGITAQFFGRLVGAWGKKIGNAGAAALEFGGINAAGVLADAYIGDNIAGRPWQDEDGNILTGNDKDMAVLRKAGAEFRYGGMQSLLMSMGGGVARATHLEKAPTPPTGELRSPDLAARRKAAVAERIAAAADPEGKGVAARGENGETLMNDGSLLRTAEDGSAELVTPDGVVLDAEGNVKTVAAGNVGQTGEGAYGTAITVRTNPLTGRQTAARETVRNALVALQEGVTADMLREIDGWTPENKAVFQLIEDLRLKIEEFTPGELVDAYARLGLAREELQAFGLLPDAPIARDAEIVARLGTSNLQSSILNLQSHIPLEIAAEVARSVNAGTTGLMPKELGKRQLEVARQLMAERAKAKLEESAAEHGNTPEAERKVLDTPVENEDGTLQPLSRLEESGGVGSGGEGSPTHPLTQSSLDEGGLRPAGDGTWNHGAAPEATVRVAEKEGGGQIVLIEGLTAEEMLRPERREAITDFLIEVIEKSGGNVAIADPRAEAAANELLAARRGRIEAAEAAREQAEVVQLVEAGQGLVDKLFGKESGIKVRVGTDAEAEDAARGVVGQAASRAELHDTAGRVRGYYDRKTGEVVLFPGATIETVAHEVAWHATWQWAEKNSPRLLEKMRQYAEQCPDALRELIKEAYKDFGPEALIDELGAGRFENELGGRFRDLLKTDAATRTWWQSVKAVLKEMWRSFVKTIDGGGIDLDKMDKMEPAEAMRWLAEQMMEGRRLGERGTRAEQEEDGKRLSLVGTRKDGIEVYESDAAVLKMPYRKRKRQFLDVMTRQYAGRTARFTRNGQTYYATFEQGDVRKNIHGDAKSDREGLDAKINAGASGDMFDLVENARYDHTSQETGKRIRSHGGVKSWDYFDKTVQIDNKVFDVVINVRDKGNEQFVYNVQLNRNRNIKPVRHMTPSPQSGTVLKSGATGSTAQSISQSGGGAQAQIRPSIGGIYTGSAADYANRSREGGKDDGPSLKHIGSGEGSQVYGWGLYGSNVRGVAENYSREKKARGIKSEKRGKTSAQMDEAEGLAAYYFEQNNGDVGAAIRELREYIKNDKDNEKLVKSLTGAVKELEEHGGEYEMLHENLYEQTFFTNREPGDESHLLKWYEPVSEEQLKWVRETAEKEGVLDDRFRKFLDAAEGRANGEDGEKANGDSLYLHAQWALGSPKAASEFLYRAGIDGVKYPVDSYGKTLKDGDEAGWNYVSFSDENIRVDHKWTDGQLRFSIGGVRGAEKLGVGKAADAEQMEKDGASREEIWRKTGWWRAKDGRWRVELPDFTLKMDTIGREANESDPDYFVRKRKLPDIITDTRLFEAYPELKKITVETPHHDTFGGASVLGDYNGKRRIRLNTWAMMYDPEQVRSTLAHEIQHAIQYIEGFAKGGNEGQFKGADPWALRQKAKAERKRGNETEAARLEAEAEEIEENALEGHVIENGEDYEDTFEAYRSLSGETESRNVEKRLAMSPEERAATPPWATEDVPEDRQIIRFSRGGTGTGEKKKDVPTIGADMSEPGNAKAFRKYLSTRDAAPMPERLKDGRPRNVLQWFTENMVGKTFEFDIPGIGHREFRVKAGHLFRLVCDTPKGRSSSGKTIRKGFVGKAKDADEARRLIETGEVTTGDIAGWNEGRARSLPLIPEILESFDAVFREKARPGFLVFVKKFVSKSGHVNTVVMRLNEDGETLGPMSAHMKGITAEWLKGQDLAITDDGKVFTRQENSASSQVDSQDNAEGNSRANAESIPQDGGGGNSDLRLSRGAGTERRVTPEEDAAYADAVKRGDMETVRRMEREAYERMGYSDNSGYQGTSAFNGAAPSRNAYFETKAERIEATKNGEMEDTTTLGDFRDGIDVNNLQFIVFDPRSERNADPMRQEAIRNVRGVLDGGKDTITMYRSVPADVKEGQFRNGDWITPSRAYAEDNARIHGWGEKFRIIEQEVSVEDVWWDGNDIAEWGFDDGKGSVYKNTLANRKLLGPTYDDAGNLIPLSKRFNDWKQDIRFSRGGYKPGDWRKTFTFGKAARSETERTPGGEAAGEERRRWEENPVDERIPEWDAPGRNPNVAKPFALSASEGYRILKALGGEFRKTAALKDVLGVIDASDEAAIREDLKGMGFFKGDDILWAATATPAEVAADRADSQAALDARLEKLGEQRLKGEAGGGNRGAVRVMMSQVADLALKLPAETGGNLGNVRTLAQGIVRGFERERDAGQMAYYLQEAKQLIDWFYGKNEDLRLKNEDLRLRSEPSKGESSILNPQSSIANPRKLLARAFGAWLEAPDAVAEHAPGLYREFVDAVARNAKLSAAFDAIRRTALGEGSASRVYAEIEQSRTVAAETAAARLEDEARKPFGTKWERMKDSFVYNFDDMHGPIFMHIDRAQKRQLQELSASLKAGRITQAEYDAVAGAFERAVKGLKIAQLTVDRGWQNEIRQYLWDMGRLFEEAKAAGVDPKNVQRYMDLRWIVSSGGRAGARGMSARDAQLVLDNMERQLGAEEFARLEGVAARFHAVREKNLLDDPRLVAMIGQDRVNYFKNNVHYVRTERLRATPEELARMEADRAQFRRDNPGDDDVTAAMLKLLAKTGGRGGGAGNSTWGHALEGSTRDIGDRFAATWRNDTRLIAAIERNDFVLQMRDALLAAKTPGVRDLPGSKGVQYPQNERYGHIRYFDGGQARVLVVPRVLADGYRQVSDSMNGWSAWGKIAHGVFIDWNLAYTLRNMTRNMASNESNIVGMRADNATIVGNALVPGAGRLASMASYQIARHLPEWVFNNPLARVVYGEHVNAAYARQAQRILELYLDPKKAVERHAQAEEARLRGDTGPAAELAADLDMLRFVTKGNALIARWDQVRGQGRDADDFMRSHGLGSVYGESAPQAPASRAQRILARAGDFLSYPFRRNARFNRELELHAKITAALAIHDRQPGLSAQEVGVEVARRASIPQSERHGAQAKFINYAWNMFYNTALKGGQRFVGNVTRNPRLLGKMAAQSLGPQLFWATMIAGGGLTAVIRNMFGGGDDAEEKAREAGLGGLLDYTQFMHDGSFAASPYLQRFYHWCPLWEVSGGRYLGIATPRTDEEKMLLPFVDWAAKYLAPQPTDPTATMADAAKRAAVGTFLPDMTARTPLVAAAQDLVFAWFQNPMDTYRGSRVYDNNLFQARFESGADAAAFFGATLKQGLNDLGGRSLLASKRNEIDAAGAQPPTWGERMLHDIPGLSGVLAGTLRMTLTKEQRMDQIEKEQLRPIRAVKNLRSQDLMRMMLEDPVGNGGNETPEMKEKLDAWAAKYGWDQDERDNVFARAFNGYQAATAEGQALAERKKQVGRRKRWAKLPESERKAMEAAGLREIEAE